LVAGRRPTANLRAVAPRGTGRLGRTRRLRHGTRAARRSGLDADAELPDRPPVRAVAFDLRYGMIETGGCYGGNSARLPAAEAPPPAAANVFVARLPASTGQECGKT
jgi:hypothetical protein